jgi:hypothetical protein
VLSYKPALWDGRRMRPLLVLVSIVALAAGWTQKAAEQKPCEGFCIPSFELKGNLAKIFSISGCEFISGLTCRIHYNGHLPLPSGVYFTEFDERGKPAGGRVRLIYPEMKKGETGIATFRVRIGNPAKIVLEGEWKGPYRSPY